MSTRSSTGSRVVFVGNIPYDFTEPQLIDIFNEVGTVVSFRLVFDRDSGKPKGFGFCTYQDAVTASSAVRNLNGYDVGGRQLRVDYADAERDDQPPQGSSQTSGQQPQITGGGSSKIGRFDDDTRRRGGTSTPGPRQTLPGTSASEIITQIIGALNPEQLIELMSHIKVLLQSNPEQCRILLIQNPQLAYAIFQALLVMNVVDQYTMQRILQTQTAVSASTVPPVVSSVPGAPAMPTPASAVASQQAQLAGLLEEQQKQLLIQVLNMTPDQIAALPVDQQHQIMMLRAQVLGS